MAGSPRDDQKEAKDLELCPVKDRGENMGPRASESQGGIHKVYPVSTSQWRNILLYPYQERGGGLPEGGIIKALEEVQNENLRRVVGAFRLLQFVTSRQRHGYRL